MKYVWYMYRNEFFRIIQFHHIWIFIAWNVHCITPLPLHEPVWHNLYKRDTNLALSQETIILCQMKNEVMQISSSLYFVALASVRFQSAFCSKSLVNSWFPKFKPSFLKIGVDEHSTHHSDDEFSGSLKNLILQVDCPAALENVKCGRKDFVPYFMNFLREQTSR